MQTGTEFAQRFTMQMPPSMVRVNNDTVDWTLADPKVFSQAPDSIDWVTKGTRGFVCVRCIYSVVHVCNVNIHASCRCCDGS